jgi:phosphodiesterase/alkaline phosphatase D-like protein
MWYQGNNLPRAVVGGTPVKKGIIERRDEYLKLIVNESPKVAAILTGDEHNYNKLELGPETEIYPNRYEMEKIVLNRTIFQINNGAAGAPYYAQEVTPWTPHVSNFSTQNALVLIDVEGSKINVRVLNPDTLEKIDEFILRE